MPNSSSCKGQFFIVTVVGIIIILYAMSRVFSPYTIPELSEAVMHKEVFFFNNVKEKLVKTVEISECEEMENNLEEFKNFTYTIASESGYKLRVFYNISYGYGNCNVSGKVVLTSEDMELSSDFFIEK